MRAFLMLLVFALPAFGQSFMPENDLYKQDTLEAISNISEQEFNDIISHAENFYKPLFKKAHGSNLVVLRKWTDPTVNAYAVQYGTRWEVHMLGGMARRKEVTKDGFALVICHELGHHVSGFPFVRGKIGNEGNSDYFATLSCARELWKDQEDENAEHAESIPAYPKALCDKAWKAEAERNLCYRMAEAGKSLAALLSQGTAKYETPSRQVVNATYNMHPAGQCRLDTYLAGAICRAEFDKKLIPASERDAAKYSCLESRRQAGFRPKCWFKPTI